MDPKPSQESAAKRQRHTSHLVEQLLTLARLESFGVPRATESVLDKLLRNTSSHCPPGSHVKVQILRQDGQVRIVVLDDGPGMPAEERAQAFERFFRGQGAGLRVTVEWRDG